MATVRVGSSPDSADHSLGTVVSATNGVPGVRVAGGNGHDCRHWQARISDAGKKCSSPRRGVVPDETGCGVVAPVRAALVAAGCSEGPSEVRAAFAIGRASAGMDKSGRNCGGPNEVDSWVERCDADRVQHRSGLGSTGPTAD